MNAWDRPVLWLAGRPALALTVALALGVASAALAPGIPFRSDATEQLPSVSPEVGAWLDLSRRFDAFNSLIVGLEEPSAPLTAEGLAHLKRVTERLAALKAQGVLGVASVANVDSIREADDGSLETELLIPQVPGDAAGLTALRQRIAADVQVSGALISRDQRGYLVLVRADPRHDTAELARLVEGVIEAERGPLAAFYFGAPFFSAVITRDVYARLPWLVPCFVGLLLAVLAVLAVRLRRLSAVALLLGSTAFTLLLWAGAVRLLGIVLSFTSLTALLALVAVAAAAFSRGLEARLASPAPDANPFPAPVLAGLLAVALGALSLRALSLPFLAAFGTVVAVGAAAVTLVGALFFAPLAVRLTRPEQPAAAAPRNLSPLAGVLLALAVTAAGALAASRAHFAVTPQTIFSERDAVGRSLAFFDRRFGGPDFIQVDFKGDLRDPQVAARLLRLTDLLEGSGAFPDVRSVAQVLSFLSKGFSGLHRVPPARESLANLWFFLEGRPDVRNLASEARDEAMVVLRVPTHPDRPAAELAAVVNGAVADSLTLGPPGAKARLLALARAAHVELTPAHADLVLAAATAAPDPREEAALATEVQSRLHAWLASPDSPYQPTAAEWERLVTALAAPEAERPAALAAATATFQGLGDPTMAGQLVDSVQSRVRDLRLSLRAQRLSEQLWPPRVSEALRVRAQGVVADLLDAPHGSGESAAVLVSGLPVVAMHLEHDLLAGLWRALVALVGVGGLVWLLATRSATRALRATLEAAAASALTLALACTLGPGVDSGSATLFLTPALAALVLSGAPRQSRLPGTMLLALGLASLTLMLVGLVPVTRIGAAMGLGLGAVVAVQLASRRFSQ